MTPWDDVEVDSDGDEMLDWLWDLPDRYDVGIDENSTAPVSVVDSAGRLGVRKRLRRPGEAAAAAAPEAAAGWAEERPTEALDLAEPLEDPSFGDETVFVPVVGRESRQPRYTTRHLATAAAVVLAVLAVAGIGYALVSNKGGTPKPSNLAIGNPATTTATTNAGVIATPGAATPSPTDTTTVPPDTTTTAPPPADNGAAGGFGGFTTTTVRQCLVAGTCQVPPPNTAVPNTTSTTLRVVPPTTTTAPPATTTTTLPPATTTTTVKSTTTTTVASTTTTTVATTTSSTTKP